MHGLKGRHTCQLDARGRVSFPSPFRRQVSAGLVLRVSKGSDYLELLTPDSWNDVQEALRKLRPKIRDPDDYRRMIRRVNGNAEDVEPDTHGRIRISPAWREAVGLTDSVLFVGADDRIELWDPDRYKEEDEVEVERDEDLDRAIYG